jgi:hypothetical protein
VVSLTGSFRSRPDRRVSRPGRACLPVHRRCAADADERGVANTDTLAHFYAGARSVCGAFVRVAAARNRRSGRRTLIS